MDNKQNNYAGRIFGCSILLCVISLTLTSWIGYTSLLGSFGILLLAFPILIMFLIIFGIVCIGIGSLFKHYQISPHATWLAGIIPALYIAVLNLSAPLPKDNYISYVPPGSLEGGWLYMGDRSQFLVHSSHVSVAALVYLVFAIFPIVIAWTGTLNNQEDRNKFIIGNSVFAIASISLLIYTIF